MYAFLLGVGLPLIFAFGIRFMSVETATVSANGTPGTQRNQAAYALALALFAIVAAAVVIGILFIAKDFIGHQFGWYILGAKQK
ncbi:hypothetical protein FGL95_23070 [Nocardiaceae bacterium YC2-7]|uniref:Transmembrane protein n=2 Tax=Antrihabitans stalactiti TaxID=2584121 RepID=A0A848KMP0_9NOCA|nr:hypothetical protein [Antrihabitans stalactiti]NMN97922.1 hypothetical protein [Antrihabitans stalactiti]